MPKPRPMTEACKRNLESRLDSEVVRVDEGESEDKAAGQRDWRGNKTGGSEDQAEKEEGFRHTFSVRLGDPARPSRTNDGALAALIGCGRSLCGGLSGLDCGSSGPGARGKELAEFLGQALGLGAFRGDEQEIAANAQAFDFDNLEAMPQAQILGNRPARNEPTPRPASTADLIASVE